ncbi:MAG: transposase [Desulfobacteraceae bacterium]|nr:transposase [Desulfobacteraceae bacterium]
MLCRFKLALDRIYKNKSELLLVLQRPEIPLHNNLSENDIRGYVKKKKISRGTRNENGRRCRDTFSSLKKTCRKLGISFWDYLKDRLSGNNSIPLLSDCIRHRAKASAG